jgi:hypothetical protein
MRSARVALGLGVGMLGLLLSAAANHLQRIRSVLEPAVTPDWLTRMLSTAGWVSGWGWIAGLVLWSLMTGAPRRRRHVESST